jgi:hypothetical protein
MIHKMLMHGLHFFLLFFFNVQNFLIHLITKLLRHFHFTWKAILKFSMMNDLLKINIMQIL